MKMQLSEASAGDVFLNIDNDMLLVRGPYFPSDKAFMCAKLGSPYKRIRIRNRTVNVLFNTRELEDILLKHYLNQEK